MWPTWFCQEPASDNWALAAMLSSNAYWRAWKWSISERGGDEDEEETLVHEEKQLTMQLYDAQLKAIQDAITSTQLELKQISDNLPGMSDLQHMLLMVDEHTLGGTVPSASDWVDTAAAAHVPAEWLPIVLPGAFVRIGIGGALVPYPATRHIIPSVSIVALPLRDGIMN